MARQANRNGGKGQMTFMGLSVAIGFAAATLAVGQSAQIIRMEDDGSGAVPQFVHLSVPDFAELRQPEFTQKDVPTFVDKLVLSEAQSRVVESLISQYLESFKGLTIAYLPPNGGPMRISLGPDGVGVDEVGEGGENGGQEAVFMTVGDEMPDLMELMEDDPELAEMEGDMPRQMAVGVQVEMAAPGPDGETPAPGPDGAQPGVSVSIQGANGEELPEEVRKKLEEAAAKMAEKLKEQMEQHVAEGGDPHAAMPLGGAISIEELQQRQAETAKKVEEFRKERDQLGQKLVTDVQSNLIPDQLERWPSLERTLLRQKSLPKGRLAGERIDLVKIVETVDLAEADRSKIVGDLDAYEMSMDGALKRRDAYIATANRDVDEAMQANDPDKALAIIDKATDLRMAVRAVNQQFAQALAAQLPPDLGKAFSEKVQKYSYPLIYRTTRGQKTFDAALKLEDLSETTRTSLNELMVAYRHELADVNGQIRQAVDKFEPLEPRTAIERSKRVMNGETPQDVFGAADKDPVREAYERRRTLDDRYCKLITDMLTPEQVAQLPKAPSTRVGQPIVITRPIEAQ